MLVDAYRRSRPLEYAIPAENDSKKLLERMVRETTISACDSDGAHPLLGFIWRLAELNKSSPVHEEAIVALELADWFHEAAEHSKCSEAAINALKVRIFEETREPPELHLVIKLAQAGDDRYEFRAWRILVQRNKLHWDSEDLDQATIVMDELAESEHGATGGTIKANQLESMITQATHLLENDIEHCESELTIELFVPANLFLSCDADQLPIDAAMGNKQPLGAQWRVVLRSWDRAYGNVPSYVVGNWKAAWSKHSSAPHQTCKLVQADRTKQDAIQQLAEELAEVLAAIAHDLDEAALIARRADFPIQDIPKVKTSRLFWDEVAKGASRGKGRLEALSAEAIRHFPGNPRLDSLHVRITKLLNPDQMESDKAHKFDTPPATTLLCTPPRVDHAKGDYPELNRLLTDGIAIAVWPRQDHCKSPCARDVVTRIAASPVSQWRDSVRECRREARDLDDHAGAHLAILWDDPCKLPPDAHRRARARQMPQR